MGMDYGEGMLLSLNDLIERKKNGPPLAMLTAYDYPTARLLDEAGVDLLLVGDSLGMVVLGLADTVGVTMADMLHHTRAVRRGATRAPVVADLPYRSYMMPGQAVHNARRLMAAGADAVKLEGGEAMADQVRAITQEGIPFVGHIGMLPQSVREEGGYKKKGRTVEGAEQLLRDAHALEAAGACAMILESVMPEVAAEVTAAVGIPTIGIGSGMGTDGQVLVTPDLLGSFPWFRPPFAKAEADIAAETMRAVQAYLQRVGSKVLG
jgi:3-methyl-2-oxobutanoate hydroxymethyltransferase